MNNLKRTLVVVLLWVALAVSTGGGAARAAPAPADNAEKPATAEPMIQVSGRVMHVWDERPGLKVILVIDGFTVMTRTEQLTARDGVIWFDETKARRFGKATLGIYAETGVEYKKASGGVEKYDSVYVAMETTGELSLHHEGEVRGKADSTEMFLRSKKLRKEYLESGVRESPTTVIAPPEPAARVEPPGVREAGVPQEIAIVSQDDVRTVNFTSLVEDGMRVSIWTGGVYVMRGDMEIAADSVVIWTPEESAKKAFGGGTGADSGEAPPTKAGESQAIETKPPDEGAGAEKTGAPAKPRAAKRLAAEAYFEGHVRLTMGRRTIQCSQLYYDFQREQAMILDAKITTFARNRNVPVYFYAKEVRQLSRGIFVGTDAWMTTCQFEHPHYEVGASTMTLMDLTPMPGEDEVKPEHRRVRFIGENVEAKVRHVPLGYWPRLAGDVSEDSTALRSIRIENKTDRGTGLVTQWHLFKLLGLGSPPEGFNAYLDLDFWGKRGPAFGVESTYARKNFYGEFLSYYLHDIGSDRVAGKNVDPDTQDRGRITWRHRQYLEQNWELTLELSKISDRQFMNEFYQEEDETGKTQETLAYLKKSDMDQAVTFLASTRLNDFQTQTEFFPQIGYNHIGHSLWNDHLTYFQDSELSMARYRASEERKRFTMQTKYMDKLHAKNSSADLLADTIHEVDMPLKQGPVNIVPFVEMRTSYFEDNLYRTGSEVRVTGREGARAATQAWKVYDNVESDFWDLHRLRHINIFDISVYTYQCSVPSRDLIDFDVAEAGTPLVQGVDSTGVTELGWRQRFQTKRGPPGKQQDIDWLTMDLEATFYDNRISPRIAPDGKRAYNHLDHLVAWKVTDTATFWTDTNFNLESGTLDLFTVGTSITHSPRLSYTVAQRYIPDAHSSLTIFGFDYRINEKWQLHVLEQYDFIGTQNAQTDIVLIRRMHCWLLRLRLQWDSIEDSKTFSLEFQPVGVKEVQFSR